MRKGKTSVGLPKQMKVGGKQDLDVGEEEQKEDSYLLSSVSFD
jgi:hypothetical protein